MAPGQRLPYGHDGRFAIALQYDGVVGTPRVARRLQLQRRPNKALHYETTCLSLLLRSATSGSYHCASDPCDGKVVAQQDDGQHARLQEASCESHRLRSDHQRHDVRLAERLPPELLESDPKPVGAVQCCIQVG